MKHSTSAPAGPLLTDAENFLQNIKLGKPTDLFLQNFRSVTIKEVKELKDDCSRKAFWINLYNAWYQLLIKDGNGRKDIFTAMPFSFKDFEITLDEIEHGILRKLKTHPVSGFPKAYPRPVLDLALEAEDFRIHFALNCGLKSCPPIAFYHADKIEGELEMATLSYLHSETTYDEDKNVVETSELLNWYSEDFGGEQGILKLLASKGFFAGHQNPKLLFKPYDRKATLLDFAM